MPIQAYHIRNAGQPMKRYKITRPGAKHVRREPADNGEFVDVIYGCPVPSDDIGLKIRQKIVLTDEDAKKYAFMDLIEIPMHDAPLEIKSESEPEKKPAFVLGKKTEVEVPAEWRDLPPQRRKSLASALIGSPIRKTSEADRILEDHTRGTVNA